MVAISYFVSHSSLVIVKKQVGRFNVISLLWSVLCYQTTSRAHPLKQQILTAYPNALILFDKGRGPSQPLTNDQRRTTNDERNDRVTVHLVRLRRSRSVSSAYGAGILRRFVPQNDRSVDGYPIGLGVFLSVAHGVLEQTTCSPISAPVKLGLCSLENWRIT